MLFIYCYAETDYDVCSIALILGQEYEENCDKYKAILDDTTVTNAKRPHTSTLASAVAKQVKY